jgi:hypothetical protein
MKVSEDSSCFHGCKSLQLSHVLLRLGLASSRMMMKTASCLINSEPLALPATNCYKFLSTQQMALSSTKKTNIEMIIHLTN